MAAALRNVLGAWASSTVIRQGTGSFPHHLCQRVLTLTQRTSLPPPCHRLFHSQKWPSTPCYRHHRDAGGFRSLVTTCWASHEARFAAKEPRCSWMWGEAEAFLVVRPSSSSNSKGMASSTSASTSSSGPSPGEFSIKTMKYTFMVLGVLFSGVTGFLFAQWGSPQVDDQGNEIEDEFSHLPMWKAYVLRFWQEVHNYDKMIKEPSREKLLPDPLTEPYYQPPYTVVLEMTGVLVHPDWTYKTGWRFKKRPGVDYFLQQISPPLYETVIYTSEQGFTAYPILDTLDPQGRIMYRLFRDATRYVQGHHIKDLSCLNRDLSKVIFVDWNDKSFSMQPENALKLKKWSGNDDDRTLIDLAAFLRTIATSQVDDVRTVLAFYKQFDDPIEAFKMNQRRLEEEQQKAGVLHGVEKSDKRSSWTSVLFKRWQT